MKKKKVLFIWHAAVVESYQQYIAELAKNKDLEITLLIPPGWTEGARYVKAEKICDPDYKIIVGKVVGETDSLSYFFWGLPYYLWKIKPDLIHLFEEPYHNIAAHTALFRKIFCPKSKFIFQTFQNLVEDYPAKWINIQNKVFTASDAAIANANEMKDILLHWGYRKKIHVIYPGIETKLFSPKDPSQLRKKLGLTAFTIGYFGRITKEKGIKDLIDASNKLDFSHQLLLIGNGPDKEYFKTLSDKIVWVDAVPSDKLSGYYSALDAFALPSRTGKNWKEQFGRVLVEAMLCGVPVIGSSSGEIPNVIGEAGLVFKEQDPNDLADKITLLHSNPGLRKELSQKGLKRGAGFDWKFVAEKVYNIYIDLL